MFQLIYLNVFKSWFKGCGWIALSWWADDVSNIFSFFIPEGSGLVPLDSLKLVVDWTAAEALVEDCDPLCVRKTRVSSVPTQACPSIRALSCACYQKWIPYLLSIWKQLQIVICPFVGWLKPQDYILVNMAFIAFPPSLGQINWVLSHWKLLVP